MVKQSSDENGRSVPEWVGKNPDSMPPPRVRLRILRRYENRCYLSGLEIRPGDSWALDHILALTNGGENRETNLAPILSDVHKAKTAKDVAIRAKTDAIAKKNFGIRSEPKRKIQSRGFGPRKARRVEQLPMPKRRNV